jgi:hypothetical protein
MKFKFRLSSWFDVPEGSVSIIDGDLSMGFELWCECAGIYGTVVVYSVFIYIHV